MKLAHVTIRNVLGIENLEFNPGKVTVVKGKNGQGKTSVLEAIRAVFSGGRDATLLRKGAKEGELVLLLDNGVEISRRVRPEGAEPAIVTHPNYGRIAKPQSYLDKLVDSLSVNPLEFIAMPKTKRLEMLLEVLPINVTDSDLDATGAPMPPPGHGLVRIATARKAAYDERTGLNRAAKEKHATVAQLQSTLPAAQSADDPEETLTAAEQAVGLLQTELDRLKSEEQVALDEVRTRFAAARESWTPRIAEAREKAAAIRERASRWSSDQKTREFITKNTKDVVALEHQSQAMSAAIEKLDALKATALKDIPIRGIEVSDDDILVDGIPFDRQNFERQLRVALNVVRIRAGELGLVCIDGIESIDDEKFKAIEKAFAKNDLQAIVTRMVSDESLTVETVS